MITENIAKQFRADFNSINKLLGEKYGVAIKLYKLSYNSTSLEGQFTALLSTPDEIELEDYERLEFEKYAPSFGLSKADYKCKVKLQNGKVGLLIGFLPKARKYKFIALVGNDKYKISVIEKVEE